MQPPRKREDSRMDEWSFFPQRTPKLFWATMSHAEKYKLDHPRALKNDGPTHPATFFLCTQCKSNAVIYSTAAHGPWNNRHARFAWLVSSDQRAWRPCFLGVWRWGGGGGYLECPIWGNRNKTRKTSGKMQSQDQGHDGRNPKHPSSGSSSGNSWALNMLVKETDDFCRIRETHEFLCVAPRFLSTEGRGDASENLVFWNCPRVFEGMSSHPNSLLYGLDPPPAQ